MQDIVNSHDIQQMVDTFYAKIQQDELLGPVFAERIAPEAWSAHLQTMYRFWGTQLLGEKEYFGAPYAKHRTLPVGKEHFDRWLLLFNETVDELFRGPRASTAKVKAASIGQVFLSKILFERGMRGNI
ncbi:group III truncated hemoglobin [Chitinophaga sp.]|uniref:group III truncated hemoglobin n=1 Tax=Chitinophaga sp. TaxID=1869181 RepID=UPI0031D3C977